MDVKVGDIVRMKKQHPCGCSDFKILRIGMDFKLKCQRCDREFMIPRNKAVKSIKHIIKDEIN